MKPGFEDFMSIEIKKEIAERYFGFRKMIEEDNLDLVEKMKCQIAILEKRISFELIRIYILLQDDNLIQEFMKLTGWEDKLFYEPYITESETIRKKVFRGIRIRGLTRGGRFKNLVFDAYDRLTVHVEHYRANLEEIETSRETINEEIKLFYRKNDIGNIMGFLRSIESSCSSENTMGIRPDAGAADTFEDKMRIAGPPPIDPELVDIPPLPTLPNIRKDLKKLVDKAFKLHRGKILTGLAQ
ncbi:MAG: hypothetical protein JRF02_02010 [Deltaproteobacteria bacterium]|jgi:hypothetical protein|nr:hypothetical protein [Deltaproteobacteria bacterium]